MKIAPSPLKHGVSQADIEHATNNVTGFAYQDDGRLLYHGPSRSGTPLEMVKVVPSELVIHAMAKPSLLPGCRARL